MKETSNRLIRSRLLPVQRSRVVDFFSGALTTEMSRADCPLPVAPFKGIIGRSVFSNGAGERGGSTRAPRKLISSVNVFDEACK